MTTETGFLTKDGNIYEYAFLGNCVGIGLRKRGPDDLHIVFEILCEDDDNWFRSTNGFSSFWLPELIEVSKQAYRWMRKNCDLDEDSNGQVWGFKFKVAKVVQ